MTREYNQRVASHYGQPELLLSILNGLKASGIEPDAITPEDLAPVDEFHTAGRQSTLKALNYLDLKAGMNVLDAGCGIGGTSRVLASEYGCQVSGVDLTPEYIETAKALTEMMGLSDQCSFHTGSVLELPFPDNSFEAAVTFHVAMNIEDRSKLYSEVARVLKPGFRFCLFDIMKGPEDGLEFPVPWASVPETSFLKTPDETRDLLEGSGFKIVSEENLRDFSIAFFKDAMAKAEASDGLPNIGLHLLMGDNASEKYGNAIKAALSGQTVPIIMVGELVS